MESSGEFVRKVAAPAAENARFERGAPARSDADAVGGPGPERPQGGGRPAPGALYSRELYDEAVIEGFLEQFRA